MRSLCPYEIVASVVRRSHDHVMCGQRFERVFENRTRQVWAVAVEGNGASLMTFCEVRKHRSEGGSKALTRLRDDAHRIAPQASEIVHIRGSRHSGNLDSAKRLLERDCGVDN